MTNQTDIATVEPKEIAAQPTDIMQVIAAVAQDPHADVEKMERLLAMKERMDAEQRRIEFHEALVRVQADLPTIPKSGKIRLKKGGLISYAKLEDVQTIVKPLLRAEGFTESYRETIVEVQGARPLKRVTLVLSRAGHSEEYSAYVPLADEHPSRNPTQAMVSANSYGKRVALVNALDITMEGVDDDGAGGNQPITEDQVLDLDTLLTDSGANRERFGKWLMDRCGTDKLAEIPARDYDAVVQAVNQRARQK